MPSDRKRLEPRISEYTVGGNPKDVLIWLKHHSRSVFCQDIERLVIHSGGFKPREHGVV